MTGKGVIYPCPECGARYLELTPLKTHWIMNHPGQLDVGAVEPVYLWDDDGSDDRSDFATYRLRERQPVS